MRQLNKGERRNVIGQVRKFLARVKHCADIGIKLESQKCIHKHLLTVTNNNFTILECFAS